MPELIDAGDLPAGFRYPMEYLRIHELGLTELEPWWFVDGDLLKVRAKGVRERYGPRNLVLIAVRQDCDDIACWDVDRGTVVELEQFSGNPSPDDDQLAEYPDFAAWLHSALDDFLEWEVE